MTPSSWSAAGSSAATPGRGPGSKRKPQAVWFPFPPPARRTSWMSTATPARRASGVRPSLRDSHHSSMRAERTHLPGSSSLAWSTSRVYVRASVPTSTRSGWSSRLAAANARCASSSRSRAALELSALRPSQPQSHSAACSEPAGRLWAGSGLFPVSVMRFPAGVFRPGNRTCLPSPVELILATLSRETRC